MFDEYADVERDPYEPHCTVATFLHRIAFSVFHASFYIERVWLLICGQFCANVSITNQFRNGMVDLPEAFSISLKSLTCVNKLMKIDFPNSVDRTRL